MPSNLHLMGWPKLSLSVKSSSENDCTSLVLGDNIFYGAGLNDMLKQAVTDAEQNGKATVFGYRVSDPERYGCGQSLTRTATA